MATKNESISDALNEMGRKQGFKGYGYHAIHFEQHRYTMLYHVEGTNAYVEAIYHQLQDYENMFADTLNI